MAAEILDPRWTRPEDPAVVEHDLRGAHVERLTRSGKYLSGTSRATGTC